MKTSSTYTFGDNAVAARRLELLAKAFEASSLRFIRQIARSPRSCLDLGCGPGAMTRLVHNVSGAVRTVGVERSARLLRDAQNTTESGRGITFLQHDLERVPYPIEPAELVHIRFLLTHFNDPGGGLLRFGQLLVPGGKMMVQEIASLNTQNETFVRYYELVRRLQAHHGQTLEVGSKLSVLALQTPLQLERFETKSHSIPARTMAELHAMNMVTWRNEPFALHQFDPSELDVLHQNLCAIARGLTTCSDIEVSLGQLTLVAA